MARPSLIQENSWLPMPMKNESRPNEATPLVEHQPGEWDDAWLEAQSGIARAFYQLGMLDEAEAAIQLPPGVPERWHGLTQAGLGQIAWARGDMRAVVEICYPWQHLVPLRQVWFAMVATALKNCGRIPEAIALQARGMVLNGTTPNDCYNLACFHTQADDYPKALSILVEGLSWEGFDRCKALVDTDLQPLWQRLPALGGMPEMRDLASSPELAMLADFRFVIPPKPLWDPPDCRNLPAAFGRHLVYSPINALFSMNPSAPDRVKRNFKQWTLDRARSNQRLIRRGIRNSSRPCPPPSSANSSAPPP